MPRAAADDGGGFCVAMRPRRPLPLMAFYLLWLGGWTCGTIEAVGRLGNPVAPGQDPQWTILFWLAGWVVGVTVIDTLLYLLFGREVLSISDGVLSIARQAPIRTRRQHFDLAQVKDLRVVPRPLFPGAGGAVFSTWESQDAGLRMFGITGSHLAFDYGARTYHFGATVGAEEAQQVVTQVLGHFPSLGPEQQR